MLQFLDSDCPWNLHQLRSNELHLWSGGAPAASRVAPTDITSCSKTHIYSNKPTNRHMRAVELNEKSTLPYEYTDVCTGGWSTAFSLIPEWCVVFGFKLGDWCCTDQQGEAGDTKSDGKELHMEGSGKHEDRWLTLDGGGAQRLVLAGKTTINVKVLGLGHSLSSVIRCHESYQCKATEKYTTRGTHTRFTSCLCLLLQMKLIWLASTCAWVLKHNLIGWYPRCLMTSWALPHSGRMQRKQHNAMQWNHNAVRREWAALWLKPLKKHVWFQSKSFTLNFDSVKEISN